MAVVVELLVEIVEGSASSASTAACSSKVL